MLYFIYNTAHLYKGFHRRQFESHYSCYPYWQDDYKNVSFVKIGPIVWSYASRVETNKHPYIQYRHVKILSTFSFFKIGEKYKYIGILNFQKQHSLVIGS